MNFFLKFNKISIDKACKLLYPLVSIFITMRLYFSSITITVDSYLGKKIILQQLILKLHLLYFEIIEPIIILILIKLFIEIILLFYKKDKGTL